MSHAEVREDRMSYDGKGGTPARREMILRQVRPSTSDSRYWHST